MQLPFGIVINQKDDDMGIVINKREFLSLGNSGLMRPIIYCNSDKEAVDKAISLNIPLAELLAVIKPRRRAIRMEQCMQQVLKGLPENAVIKEFDVLFNPDYEIDILRILIAQYKLKQFDVIWPGKYEDGKLIYAEEGYSDYKTYEISKYDITCVI